MKTIVLFDLDGTVLTFPDAPPGPGRLSMDLAIERLFGVPQASAGVRFAGGTDHAIARALLLRVGLATEVISDMIPRVISAYLEALEEVLATREYRPVGDVGGCVAGLLGDGFVVGVATGNVRAGAERKLRSAGLLEVFDLALGGYGCDAESRPALVGHAVARCRRVAGDSATVIVVGDTRDDVAAAHANGAHVVGVAISEGSASELAEAGAERIVSGCGESLREAIRALAGHDVP